MIKFLVIQVLRDDQEKAREFNGWTLYIGVDHLNAKQVQVYAIVNGGLVSNNGEYVAKKSQVICSKPLLSPEQDIGEIINYASRIVDLRQKTEDLSESGRGSNISFY